MNRFLEINGYKGYIPEERHIFNEAYNIAYAIKILISNTPGMNVSMGGMEVPFATDVHVGKLLIKMHEKIDKEESDDEDVINNKDYDKGGKKRKRKRGKAE
jgi:hypothetical protein